MVPSLTPYDLSFPPKWGFHMPQTYANGVVISGYRLNNLHFTNDIAAMCNSNQGYNRHQHDNGE